MNVKPPRTSWLHITIVLIGFLALVTASGCKRQQSQAEQILHGIDHVKSHAERIENEAKPTHNKQAETDTP